MTGIQNIFLEELRENLIQYEVSENIYMAVSRRKPEPGKIYACSKLEFIGGKLKLKGWTTSIVKNVEHLGNDIFKVKTENNIYIIKVVD